MKFKIFILFFVIALVVLGYFSYPILKNRYFASPKSENKTSESTLPIENIGNGPGSSDQMPVSPEPGTTSENPDLENFLSGEKTETTKPKSTINTNERNLPTGKTLAHITTAHCNDDCNAFSMDSKLLEYCQQVCGIAPIEEVSNCDDKKDIQKDYCLKDLAITKKDSSLCENISDANIKLTCRNRITQDIIESQ